MSECPIGSGSMQGILSQKVYSFCDKNEAKRDRKCRKKYMVFATRPISHIKCAETAPGVMFRHIQYSKKWKNIVDF